MMNTNQNIINKKKRSQYHPTKTPVTYNSGIFIRHFDTIVTIMLWEKLTNF